MRARPNRSVNGLYVLIVCVRMYVCACVVCAWVPACLTVFDRHASYVCICVFVWVWVWGKCECECECAVCVCVCVWVPYRWECLAAQRKARQCATGCRSKSRASYSREKKYKNIVRNQHSRRKIKWVALWRDTRWCNGFECFACDCKKTKKKNTT